jgi:hypothetical protein
MESEFYEIFEAFMATESNEVFLSDQPCKYGVPLRPDDGNGDSLRNEGL